MYILGERTGEMLLRKSDHTLEHFWSVSLREWHEDKIAENEEGNTKDCLSFHTHSNEKTCLALSRKMDVLKEAL